MPEIVDIDKAISNFKAGIEAESLQRVSLKHTLKTLLNYFCHKAYFNLIECILKLILASQISKHNNFVFFKFLFVLCCICC